MDPRATTTEPLGPTHRPGDGLLPAVMGWVWARACIAVGFVLARVTVDILDNPGGRAMIDQGLFVWDGAYYRVLARVWYDGANPDAARFFPLYPKAATWLAPVFGGNSDIALLAISNAASLLGAILLWHLTHEILVRRNNDGWHQSVPPAAARATADRAAWMVSIFPAGFVLAFAYSEGLALALTVAALLALARRRFLWVAVLALAAAALRPIGGLLVVPIAIELLRTRPRPPVWQGAVALGAPFAGLVGAFLWINRSTGDLLLPWRLQQQIRGGFQDPVTRVLEPIGEILKGDFRDVYNFGFMVVLVFFGYQAFRRRQPVSWLAFMVASWLVLVSSQVTDSLGRYGLLVVPFIVGAAQWADSRRRQTLYAVLSSAGMVWLVSEALIGRMVP